AGFETTEIILGHSNPLVAHYGDWLRENYPQHIKKFIYENMKPIDVTCGQGVYRNDVPEEAYSSTYVGERTCAYIRERARAGEAFYCFASFPDPHWPICPPEPWFSMYDGLSDDQIAPFITSYAGERDREESPPTFNRYGPYDGGGHFMENSGDAYKITRAYWGSVSLIDKNIGKMLDTLKQCGIEDNTIVVFTTDHGDYMGAHGMMAKGGFLWEEFINIPYIVSYPAKYKPKKSDALFSLIDAVPTILDSAGIAPETLASDGVSHHDMLMGNGEQARDSVMVVHFAASSDKQWSDIHCLIYGRYKLVYHAGSGKGELYDLESDPRELKNLYEAPAYSEIRQELIIKLLDRLIIERDMEPLQMTRKADHYGEHEMKYEKWKTEFESF
ncbi:MAG: sulfatase-like hydrolase/transferase, partial [Oscillospiraceae bacterium]|nr:sulfatase-like hydrolase/transferase [Oscillospiraceae bacterium]